MRVVDVNKNVRIFTTNKSTKIGSGWYHSDPEFGCWLSGADVSTQQSFEQLNQLAVAVVIDQIQSVKCKVLLLYVNSSKLYF